MDSWLLEITAFSCFMTFICTGGVLAYIVAKEQAWAQTLDWIRDELNGISYHVESIDGRSADIRQNTFPPGPNAVKLEDVLDGIERVEKAVKKVGKQEWKA